MSERPVERLPRRRMAYAAVAGILATIAAAYIHPLSEPNASIVSAAVGWLAWGWLTYMGVQVAPDIVAAVKGKPE